MKQEQCSCQKNVIPVERPDALQAPKNTQSSKTSVQRSIGVIKLIVPPVLLALIPKCPVCVAGYIALATGVGVSFTTAAFIRILLIILCAGSLCYFVCRHLQVFKKNNNL